MYFFGGEIHEMQKAAKRVKSPPLVGVLEVNDEMSCAPTELGSDSGARFPSS
jgi:hypothetical protein